MQESTNFAITSIMEYGNDVVFKLQVTAMTTGFFSHQEFVDDQKR